MFANEKEQIYEQLMQTPPNNTKRKGSGKQRQQPFKYIYKDISCKYCLYWKKCKIKYCPSIIENLEDLLSDDDFINAINESEQCQYAHKKTLILLKKLLKF